MLSFILRAESQSLLINYPASPPRPGGVAHWYSVCGTDRLDEDTMAETLDCISVQLTIHIILSKKGIMKKENGPHSFWMCNQLGHKLNFINVSEVVEYRSK